MNGDAVVKGSGANAIVGRRHASPPVFSSDAFARILNHVRVRDKGPGILKGPLRSERLRASPGSLLVTDLLGGAPQDLREALQLLGRGRRLESGDEGSPDLPPGFVDRRMPHVSLGRFASEKHLPYALHLLADLFELRQQSIGVGAVFSEL